MKKIAEFIEDHKSPVTHLCRHLEHHPPSHIDHCSLTPGVYEHECPGCGAKALIYINSQIIWTGATK